MINPSCLPKSDHTTSIRSTLGTIFKSALMGTYIGSIPGTGSEVAAFIAYFMEYYEYSVSPVLLALILYLMAEQNLRLVLILVAIFMMVSSYYRIEKTVEKE
jgi:TctA family transporter